MKSVFADRLEALEETSPGYSARWTRLRTILLGHGGTDVVVFGVEQDLDKIIERGRVWDSELTPVNLRLGEPRDCHGNAARLHAIEENEIVTGYALSEDGLWRCHSWCCRGEELYETTSIRTKYFGVVLTSDEADEFAFLNP